MPTGHFIDINDTTIFPSARISDRVPFGTGKAMDKWQNERPSSYLTYNLKSFLELKTLFIEACGFFNVDDLDYEVLMDKLPNSIKLFLNKDGFEQVVARLNSQSNNLSLFINNWYLYFDGFKVLKYLHFARDNYYDNNPVAEEAKKLVKLRWQEDDIENLTPANLLAYFRQKDRNN